MAAIGTLPSLDYLRSILEYNPKTGVFLWLFREDISSQANSLFSGKMAGHINSKGYRVIKIKGKAHKAHRLAWLLHTGISPLSQIDHKNGIRDDNRIENLRIANPSDNARNCKGKKTRHFDIPRGVRKHGNRFVSSICFNWEHFYLGVFDTAEEAHEAYSVKAKELFGDFACTTR